MKTPVGDHSLSRFTGHGTCDEYQEALIKDAENKRRFAVATIIGYMVYLAAAMGFVLQSCR